MTDMTIQENVSKELRFEPMVNAAHIGVAVNGGAVTLSGHVGSFAEQVENWTKKQWDEATKKWAKDKKKWADCRKQSNTEKLEGQKKLVVSLQMHD